MNVTRWNPFRELEEMSERLNRIFGRPDATHSNGKEMLMVADWIPLVDISETDGEFEIRAELPEVRKEDLKVTLEDGVLTLQGERRQEHEERGRKIHRSERPYGRFVRSFSIPDVVDDTKMRAEFKNGVLYLRLPKSEKAKPRAIEVKVA